MFCIQIKQVVSKDMSLAYIIYKALKLISKNLLNCILINLHAFQNQDISDILISNGKLN